ncbi:Superkiller protein 3, partial [Kickxella alabastrina]
MTEREVLQRMFAEESALDARTVDAEVAKRRTRLAAGPLAKVMRDVRMEVWAQSGVLQTLARLIVLSLDADERLRWEEEYFAQLRLRTGYIGGSAEAAEMAEEAARVAVDLVRNARCPQAFEFLMDAAACAGVDSAEIARAYARAFGDGRLAHAARAGECSDPDEAAALAAEGRRRAPESPFALVQALAAAERACDWRAVVDAGAAARAAIAEHAGAAAAAAAAELSGAAGPQAPADGVFGVDASVGHAFLAIGAEHAGDAEAAFRRCLAHGRRDARATLGLGLALCALGQAGESRRLLQAALDADAGAGAHSHLALGGLGAVMLSEGDAAGAAACLERAVALAPGHAAHHARLGWALWQAGGGRRTDRRGAFASWLAAARLDPGDASAFGGLALWYAQAGDAAREQRCLEKAVALDAANGAAGERLAAVYVRMGRDDLAQRLLERALATRRQQPWAWRMLGLLRLRAPRQAEGAVVAFRAALAADRADAVAWEGLGDAYLAVGRTAAAVRVAARAVELAPARASGHWLAARAALAAGDPDAALGHLAAAPLAGGAWAPGAGAVALARAEALVACAARCHAQGLFARAADAGRGALAALAADAAAAVRTPFLAWGLVLSACTWVARAGAAGPSAAVEALARHACAAEAAAAPPPFLRDTRRAAAGGLAGGRAAPLFALAERAASLRILAAASLEHAAAAWAALGQAYCAQHARQHPAALGAAASAPSGLLAAAGRCARAAVRLDARSFGAHLLQGTVATWAGDAALAQHALIVATRVSRGDPALQATAWAALGLLCLHRGDADLATRLCARAL